jgi:serine protease Do
MFRRLAVPTGLGLALGVLSPAPAFPQAAPAARAGGSILWLLRPTGRLTAEQETRGALSSSDYTLPSDAFIDLWEIQGKAGESMTIDLKSQDFDAVLYVVGEGLGETLNDDDGGGRCDARVEIRFLEDGTYRVAATTAASRRTGVYTIRASANPPPPPDITCGGTDPAAWAALPVAGRLALGGTATGSLGAGDAQVESEKYADVYEFSAQAGQSVKFRLEADGFDTYLVVIGPGIGSPLTDDDSGGELNAELTVTFPEAGTYRIIATSAGSGSTGAYRLTASQ